MGKILGGILLVSGTAIGAGMLALPVATGLAGFYPTLLLLAIYWAFLTFTAFLYLEIALWLPPHTNLISMARQILGRPGALICWSLYLYLLYALLTAYLAGGGAILLDLIETIGHTQLPFYLGPLLLLSLFSFFVYKGHRPVDLMNRILMGALSFAYVALILSLIPSIRSEFLTRFQWQELLMGSSIVATSFGFHIIIPTLVSYLERDVHQLRWAVFLGCLFPLIIYLIWEWVALGILPVEGEHGILQGYIQGANGATLLADYLNQSSTSWIARLFSLFAIVTSFLGVSLSLSDCLADAFSIKKNRLGKLLLYALTFMAPLLIALVDPRAFLTGLEYAGAFGVMVLLGLFPLLMVWKGRYQLFLTGSYKTPGGKWSLLLAAAFALVAIGIEVWK